MKKGFLTVLLILTIITNLVTPVFASISVSDVTLNKTSTSITIGSSEVLVASVSPVDATNQEVTWSSDNTAVATVDSSGEVSGISAGTASITVTTTDGGYTASCTVEVIAANIAVTEVSLNKTSTSIAIGANETLVASISPIDATNQEITWSSDNTAVATVNSSGEVSGVSAGTASITVTTTDGGYTASCTVEVTAANIAVSGVSLNKTSTSIAIGANETLVASISPIDATNQEITWSSDNTAVATVNSSGEVSGVSAGTASITVTTTDGGYIATCIVEIIGPQIPTNIVTTTTHTTVNISWDEVSGATGYDIEADEVVIDVGSETTYKHGGLDTESEHTYRVRAKNESGAGLWSDSMNATTLSPITVQITVDGNDTEWAEIPSVALGEDDTINLSAVQDSNNLYMLIRGTNIGNGNDFYIDSDNDSATGNNNTNWLDIGADFLIDDEELWHWVNDNWEYVDDIVIARNSTTVEVTVELSQIGRTGPGEMRLSYDRYDANCAPAAGNTTAMIDMMITEPDDEIVLDGSVYSDVAKYYQYCLKALEYTDINNNPINPNGYFEELSYSALNKFLEEYQFTCFNIQSSEKLMEEAENLADMPIQSGFENPSMNHNPVVFMYSDIANIDNLNNPFYSMQVLKGYPYLVTTEPSSLSYTSKRVTEVIKEDTKLFGYVYMGTSDPYLDRSLWQMADLGDIKSRIDQLSIAGWYGVFIDQFGYDFGETRVRQNEIVDYAHSKGLKCFVNAWFPEDAMDSEVKAYANPEGISSHLNSEDWYLVESFFTSTYCSRSNKNYLNKYLRIKQYHDTTGVNISVLSYERDDLTAEESNDYIKMSYILSQCLGYDGWWYDDGTPNTNLIQNNDIGLDIGDTLIQELYYDSGVKHVAETDQYIIEYYASDNPGLKIIPVSGIGETIIIGNTTNIPVTGICLNKTSITINEGNSVALVATIEPENASDMSYSWMSNNTAVATVNGNGNVTGVSEGTANIIVTTTDGGHTATCEVTVIEGYGITIDGSDADWTGIEPILVVEDEVIDSISAIQDENKLYIIVKGTNIATRGTFFLDVDNDAGTGYIDMYWNGELGADYLLDGYNKVLYQHSGATQQNYNWAVVDNQEMIKTDTVVEASVELSDIGLTSPGTIKIGYIGNNWNYQPAALARYSPNINTIWVRSINLNKESITMRIGETEVLEATIEPANATNQDIIWTSNNEAAATVDINGLVTGISVGEATITATTADGEFIATCAVEVSQFGITIDGSDADWAGITPIVAGQGEIESLSAIEDGGKLYVLVKGTNLDQLCDLFIDTDNDTATGYWHWGWGNAIGADYWISNDYARKHIGTNTEDWNWAGAGTGVIARTDSTIEVAIDLETFGMTEPGTIKIGYIRGNSQRLPVAVLREMTIDGSDADWAGIEPILVVEDEVVESISAIQVENKLYIMVKGTNIASRGTFYLDSDNNEATGYIDMYWQGKLGTDYSLDGYNSNVYRYTGTGWGYVGPGQMAKTETVVEAAIDLSYIGLTTPGTIKIGYIGTNWNYQPIALARYSLDINTIWVREISLNKESTIIQQGETETLVATIEPVTATNQAVTWSSSNTAVATVDANGVVTGVSVGTATITATTADGGFADTCAVEVSQVGITIDGSDADWAGIEPILVVEDEVVESISAIQDENKLYIMVKGTNIASRGTFYLDSDNNEETGYLDMYWEGKLGTDYSLDGYNSNVYRYTGTGWGYMGPGQMAKTETVVEAAIDLNKIGLTTPGTIKIGYIGTGWNYQPIALARYSPDINTVWVRGISLNKESTAIITGETETLTASIEPVAATNQDITWSSSNTAVATVDANGVVTGISAGTATITATSVDGGFVDTCAVTITI